MADTIKTQKLEELSEEERRDLLSFLYAVALIRGETGHGTIKIEIRDGKIAVMRAEHEIRPKYMNIA